MCNIYTNTSAKKKANCRKQQDCAHEESERVRKSMRHCFSCTWAGESQDLLWRCFLRAFLVHTHSHGSEHSLGFDVVTTDENWLLEQWHCSSNAVAGGDNPAAAMQRLGTFQYFIQIKLRGSFIFIWKVLDYIRHWSHRANNLLMAQRFRCGAQSERASIRSGARFLVRSVVWSWSRWSA